MVQSQPGQIVCETLSPKKPHHERGVVAGGVTQGIGPEFTPSTTKKKYIYIYHNFVKISIGLAKEDFNLRKR
jgi:hypothetical protein